MLIFRYLAKEVFTTLFALTTILLLIFMSNQFVRYLGRAASGSIPAAFIFKLLALELPLFMGLLMPLGFYMALLLAYGRLYADSEMTVLHACGYGSNKLLRDSLYMASGIALLVLVILLWMNPAIAVERTKLLRSEGVQVMIKTLTPGRFSTFQGGQSVVYIEQISEKHTKAEDIFLARSSQTKEGTTWDVLFADSASIVTNPETNASELTLKNGKIYQGEPGAAGYRVITFGQYDTTLPEPEIAMKAGDLRTVKTADLWPAKGDLYKIAELQWRFSLPMMVFILTLIAVPMSRVNPRAGKYAKLLPAVLIFIVYADLMFVMRDVIAKGKIPYWLGTFGLHGTFLVLGLFLLWRSRVKLS